MKTLVVFTVLFGLAFAVSFDVETEQGKLKGSNLKSRDGRDIKAFQGIPYAKPPIGHLRLKVKVHYFRTLILCCT